MFDPYRLPASTLFGSLVRLPLRLIPRAATIRVKSGPLKGLLWRVGSSTHGCWLGTYEDAKVRVVAQSVKPRATVFDVGANAGYYSLLFARLVGREGRVLAVEPLPENGANLLHHVRTNAFTNVRVIPAAVGETAGWTTFQPAASNSMGRLGEGESTLTVAVTTLDALRSIVPEAPSVIKMDIEGGEGAALRGAAGLLAERRSIWFISLHGDEARRSCQEVLRAAGYAIRALEGSVIDDLTCWEGDEIVATPAIWEGA